MLQLIKFFSIGLIIATIIIVLSFVYFKDNKSSSPSETSELNKKDKEKGYIDLATAKADMLKKNTQLIKSPLSELLEQGKWIEAVQMYGQLGDDKFRQFMINRSTILFLQNGTALNKNIPPEQITNFFWQEYSVKPSIQNVALINISKIILEHPKKLKELQKKIEKKYYSIALANNEKAALLGALLSYRDDVSRAILEDIRTKNDAILLNAAIRALKGWKDQDIGIKLLKFARDSKNIMVSAIAYKILAVNGEKAVISDVEKLVKNKNDVLVEAGLFIIFEMKLKEFVPLVQSKIREFSYFNRRLADQILTLK